MSPILISIAVFIGVTALVGGLALAFRKESGNKLEDRLSALTGHGPNKAKEEVQASVLTRPLDAIPNVFDAILERFGSFAHLIEQADTRMTASQFFLISGGLFAGGTAIGVLAQLNLLLAPLVGLTLVPLPLMWLLFRRTRRLKLFAAQLPDALELMSRALRAGHSLQSGFDLVHKELRAPIAVEFGRVFDEQNLGLPMDEALKNLTTRVPNLDLKFFSTAIVLQRQTGGDLAEILDKIGHLIRERFKIYGQVQALTGEGRISGVVLLGLPPVLFLVVYRLNPQYIMLLFTDEMGKKMLAGAIIMQLLGAVVIRKIVNIKV